MHKLFRHTLPYHPCLRVIPALLLCLGLTGLGAAQTSQEPFRFGDVDLEFLDQIKQLDKRFEEQGLVYREPQLNAYVARLGQSLLKPENQLENVVWQFRVFIGIVDARNGDVLAYTLTATCNDIGKEDDKK